MCHVERNSFAASTLVARMADASLDPAPIWDDLRSFDGRAWRGRVHIITAGYPCQPFTYSGVRRGEDDPRHLWPEVARIVSEVRPRFCFFENVPGHLSLGFDVVCRDLQEMGYRVAARVVSAAEIGGPHTRERLFILAHTDIQRVREPRLHLGRPQGTTVQDRQKPNRFANRDQECGQRLDAHVGSVERLGLDTGDIPLFPPLPGRFAEWGETLNRSPELKPSVHGLDDGVACGLDRSAAAGNGVVPMAAARAFKELLSSL